jgi:hypothetical protein
MDVGIDERGSLIVSKGSTAQAGTSTIQVFDMASTELYAGIYYMAMRRWITTLLPNAQQRVHKRVRAGLDHGGTFVLPSTATFAVPTVAFCPDLAVHFVGAGGAV